MSNGKAKISLKLPSNTLTINCTFKEKLSPTHMQLYNTKKPLKHFPNINYWATPIHSDAAYNIGANSPHLMLAPKNNSNKSATNFNAAVSDNANSDAQKQIKASNTYKKSQSSYFPILNSETKPDTKINTMRNAIYSQGGRRKLARSSNKLSIINDIMTLKYAYISLIERLKLRESNIMNSIETLEAKIKKNTQSTYKAGT